MKINLNCNSLNKLFYCIAVIFFVYTELDVYNSLYECISY